MSIVRIGLAETKKFAEGYEAIFGKKTAKAAETTDQAAKPAKKAAAKPAGKKAPRKK